MPLSVDHLREDTKFTNLKKNMRKGSDSGRTHRLLLSYNEFKYDPGWTFQPVSIKHALKETMGLGFISCFSFGSQKPICGIDAVASTVHLATLKRCIESAVSLS